MSAPNQTATTVPDFPEVNELGLANIDDVLENLGLAEGGKLVGKEFQMLNPNRDDGNLGSFSINIETGVWKDFAGGDEAKGGDVISLVAYILDVNQYVAKNWLAVTLGMISAPPGSEIAVVPSPRNPAKAKKSAVVSNDRCIQPIPQVIVDQLLARAAQSGQSFDDVAVSSVVPYLYRNAAGEVMAFSMRYTMADGTKKIMPYSYWSIGGDAPSMKYKAPVKPYTLYNQDKLAANPNAPVLVVEGEKSADAASILFPDHVVVTTMFGAQSPLKSDLTPLVGRDVTFWPDNDDAGLSYVDKIAEHLQAEDML